jgi:hypothetical protein
MAERVVIDEPVVALPAGGDPISAAVEYHFPVEVEVRTVVAQADLERAVHTALASLATAVRSA